MNKRGFTLVEGLLTLVLVLIMLGAIGSLMQMYANVIRRTERKEITLYAAQVALDTVRQELRQAVSIHVPSDRGDTLSLSRVDPWNPARLPDPPPFPPPGSWNPYSSSEMMTVTFELLTAPLPEDYTFYRTIIYGDGSEFTEVVCQGLHGVEFERDGAMMTVRASVLSEDGQVDSVQTTVRLPRSGS